MSVFLAEHAELMSGAFMQGLLFEVDNYPGAIESSNPEHKVFGDLYKLNQPELLLAQLDEYEECTDTFPQPHEYLRKILPIKLLAGGQAEAWVYVFNRDTAQIRLLASGDYLGGAC